MKRSITLAAALLISAGLFQACKDNPSSPSGPSGEYGELNSWILNQMDIYYFWQDYVPDELNGDISPEDWFESMLKEDDIFSYIVDDYQELLNDINGISYEAGYSPAFGRFSGTDSVFIIVEFTYPDTPAEDAGMQRGDIIVGINGQDLTISNYLDLYYSEGPSELTLGEYFYDEAEERNRILRTDSTITVQKAVLDLDPVVHTTTIDTSGHKIGYVYYAGFRNGTDAKYQESLNQVFTDLIGQGVTELVIDLRYNPGGSISAAVNMANAIVPPVNASANDVFVSFQYNEFLQNEFAEQQGPDSPNLFARFEDGPVNFGFDRVYFLQTGSSASASELIINGLEPYMNVYGVGTNTFGKFYGSFVLTGDRANPPNNYGIVPVTLKYANANGVSDFREGLEPDFEVAENIFDPLPLGDVNDPLFGTAIEHITQGMVSAKPRALPPIPFQLLPDPVEIRRGNILMENPDLK